MAIRIDLAAFATRREAGQLVVDVREPGEYAAGHVPGAVLLPLGELARRGPELPRDTPLLVICRSGARSQQGADTLTGLGFDAVSVDGGTAGWVREGRPVVTGPNPH